MARASRHTTRLAIGLVAVVSLIAGTTSVVAAKQDDKRPAPPPSVSSCDPLDPSLCLLPFPNDYFTVPDPTTPTGRRVNLTPELMPRNNNGTPIDPTDWNASDGFSPGSQIMTFVPGIDLGVTGAAPITDIGRSLDPDAPIVLLDADTGERHPYWAELDTWTTNQADRALVVRSARNLVEGHRYVVALRNLMDANGNEIGASDAFKQFRDHNDSHDPAVKERKKSMHAVFRDLARAGVHRKDLYLAWDFTVASAESLAGRLLHMRDDAYGQLGAGTPSFQVTQVNDNVSANVLRRVRGTFEVPMYLTGSGEPGSRLVLGPDGQPVRTGTFQAEFRCLIPRSAVGADGQAQAGRGVVYGHGLLGGTSEIEGFGPFLNAYDIVLCATPWVGMSNGDLGNVIDVIADLSTFGSIPDRLQQAHLNFQFLARLLKDPNGFGANPAFQVGSPAAASIIAGDVFYNGNSQGGILGGAATAISKEWTRAVLGVPGMNFSTLIPRSINFDPFFGLLQGSYSNERELTLSLALIQMLWDRGEANGYAHHLTDDPYPGTPAHTVLLIEAFGDHQVANIATETEARTIGAHVRQPGLAPGRSPDVVPFWDLPAVPSSPFGGSVLEMWDFGTPAPPIESTPPRLGSDPHGAARNVPEVREQVSQFLQTNGAFVDLCGPGPCQG